MAENEEERRRRKVKAMAGPSFDPYDRINQLPDCLLSSSILPYLPIKECARTSVLSSRWRYLWRFSPLDIDASSFRRERETQTLDATSLRRKALTLGEADEIAWHVGAVDTIISHHHGPIRSLRLSESICSLLLVSGQTLDRWIKVLGRKGIQNLTFYGNLPFLFYTCHSLRSLELINGHFMRVDTFPMTPLPPNLRELRLRSTLIRNADLSHILSSSRLLNTLVLNGSWYFAEIMHISSPCLRELTIAGAFHYNAALSIEEAPNLEILMLEEIFTKRTPLKVVNAPKLRQLGVVDAKVRMLEFGRTRFQRKLPINLDTRMHNLITLTTRVNFSDACQAKILAGLLTCFPCLETLNILNDGSDSSDPVDGQYWEQKDSFACLDCHLKYVKIKGFLGDEYDVGFAKFLVKNARALMMISLLCLDDVYLTEIEEETRLHELGYENRASLDVRVIFLMD